MSLRPSATSFCTNTRGVRVLQVLLLLSLLLTVLVPSTTGQRKRNLGKVESVEPYVELRCICVKTISGIHPSNIQNLEVIRPGAHCAKVQVIATLKDGREICLDPEAPRVKKIIQKLLESDESAA
ncbi:platelet basic protein [Ictidomys tridecemlineatus]|uniref:C-X-C motif chemokine n=1 Tax=Ictidomys tridecemlineatus TaxID=43179 RepID=I3MTR6_ICTTR|nr:platelet basic protein [Ictidomys tridecemlineatus]KAG3276431.1 pro-platelet basic protein [Ictidomys tridecemlineatus]